MIKRGLIQDFRINYGFSELSGIELMNRSSGIKVVYPAWRGASYVPEKNDTDDCVCYVGYFQGGGMT